MAGGGWRLKNYQMRKFLFASEELVERMRVFELKYLILIFLYFHSPGRFVPRKNSESGV